MFDTIVLSGGALKGIQMLGSLSFLDYFGLLNNVENFVGVSIGSIICFFMIIGYSPKELFDEILKSEIWNLLNMNNINIFNIIQKNFVFQLSILKKELTKFTLKKLNYIPTFQNLKKNLYVFSYNSSQNEFVTFSPFHSPTMEVIDALILSSSLPFIFEPSYYKEDLYFDGGIINNFPIFFGKQIGKKILGIYFSEEKNTEEKNETNLFKNLYSLLNKIFFAHQQWKIKTELKDYNENLKLIKLDSNISFLNFSLTDQEKINYFYDGFNQTENQLLSFCSSLFL